MRKVIDDLLIVTGPDSESGGFAYVIPMDGHAKDLLALADTGLEGLAFRIQTGHLALGEQNFTIKPEVELRV